MYNTRLFDCKSFGLGAISLQLLHSHEATPHSLKAIQRNTHKFTIHQVWIPSRLIQGGFNATDFENV